MRITVTPYQLNEIRYLAKKEIVRLDKHCDENKLVPCRNQKHSIYVLEELLKSTEDLAIALMQRQAD